MGLLFIIAAVWICVAAGVWQYNRNCPAFWEKVGSDDFYARFVYCMFVAAVGVSLAPLMLPYLAIEWVIKKAR